MLRPWFSVALPPEVLLSRVGRVDRNKYQIHIPLPPKIDPTVTMMQVEEKPDVTYTDVGGCKEQIEKLREVVETPLLHVGAPLLLFHSLCPSLSRRGMSYSSRVIE